MPQLHNFSSTDRREFVCVRDEGEGDVGRKEGNVMWDVGATVTLSRGRFSVVMMGRSG